MNPSIIEKIKQDLLKQKLQIENELAGFTSNNKHEHDDHKSTFPNYGDESDENAQEVSEYSTSLETERILETTLKDIDGALDKINRGVYGICKYCGQEIEEKRLVVRPFSSSCVNCKSKLQKS